MKRVVYKALRFLLIGFISFNLCAQNADTVELPFIDFLKQVTAFHPTAAQAQTLTQIAQTELLTARGGFDPVVDLMYNNKTADGKNNYTYFTPTLKIPTLPGIELKAGLESSSGTNISPESGKYDPASQALNGYNLWYGGVSVPIGRGLFTDTRRATLRQAELLKPLNEAEKIKQINKLLLEAAKSYWNWYQAYQALKLNNSNLDVAKNRLNFIQNRIKLGEEKSIDSVEASIEYKRREVLFLEAAVDYLNAGFHLSNYLWEQNNTPLQLKSNVIPSKNGSELATISSDSLTRLISFAENNHPEIIKVDIKIKQLQVERKLAKENLKPQLNVNYYPFRTFTNGQSDGVEQIFSNNYKFGVEFYSSIFLRKERGKLATTKFKIKQTEFELLQTRREISNEIYAAFNELQNLAQLIGIQDYLTNSALILRNAEITRFESGESSLFLVNTRERSLIDAQLKLVELRAKYAKSKLNLQWNVGVNMAVF